VTELGDQLLSVAGEMRDDMVAFLMKLARLESPSDDPSSQAPVQEMLQGALRDLGFKVRRVRGSKTGGSLLAIPRKRVRGRPAQLLLGHCDTVWSRGVLEEMPVALEGNRVRGPGVFDMKGGLTQIVFALRILHHLGLSPEATPVVLVNSDEEIGSPESKPLIARVSRRVARALVLEPAMGRQGRLKTRRKGVGVFTLRVRGKASHAGLDPEAGASAILELAHLIQTLHAMTDLSRGISLNVGVIAGGSRSNVIAAEASAELDLRVLSTRDGEVMQQRIQALTPTVPGTSVEVDGGITFPPLEGTPRNRALWRAAQTAARDLGLELEEEVAGGGSDGNTTSQYTATLDGLGPVGDGAHASHEFLFVDKLVERCALLARLLLMDP